jgi:hypothetical protein
VRNYLSSIIFGVAFLGLSAYSCQAADADRHSKQNAERAAKVLAANPVFESKSRITTVKVLKITDGNTVYVRTNRVILSLVRGSTLIEDRYFIDGANGQIKKDPNARRGDELAFKIGESCSIGGYNQYQSLLLLKIENGRAFFQHSGSFRNAKPFNEFISVAPYEDGFWKVNPKDKSQYTYTEFDEKGNKRLEQNYKNDKLQGLYITWYSNGQKETEYNYDNDRANGSLTEWYSTGQKRHESTLKDGKRVGKETYWLPDGQVSSSTEHPP